MLLNCESSASYIDKTFSLYAHHRCSTVPVFWLFLKKFNRNAWNFGFCYRFDFASVFTCPKHTPSECDLSRNYMSCFMRCFILVCRCVFRSPNGFSVNRQYFGFRALLSECLACIVYEYFFQLLCINPCKYPQNRSSTGIRAGSHTQCETLSTVPRYSALGLVIGTN